MVPARMSFVGAVVADQGRENGVMIERTIAILGKFGVNAKLPV